MDKPFPLFTILFTIFILLMFSAGVFAVPAEISYQGYLTDTGGTPADGTVNMVFRIYNDPDGDNIQWESDVVAVDVSKGVYSIILGALPQPAIPPTIFSQDLWLGITVEGDAEMSPIQKLTSVGQAITAGDSDTVDGMHGTDLAPAAHTHPLTGLTGTLQDIQLSGSYNEPVSFGNVTSQTVASATITNAALTSSLTLTGATITGGTFGSGTFSGSGLGLTLDAGQLTTGLIPDARIPAGIARDSEVTAAISGIGGPGSGLDADTVDGLSSEEIIELSGGTVIPGSDLTLYEVRINGTVKGQLNEFTLDGRTFSTEIRHIDVPISGYPPYEVVFGDITIRHSYPYTEPSDFLDWFNEARYDVILKDDVTLTLLVGASSTFNIRLFGAFPYSVERKFVVQSSGHGSPYYWDETIKLAFDHLWIDAVGTIPDIIHSFILQADNVPAFPIRKIDGMHSYAQLNADFNYPPFLYVIKNASGPVQHDKLVAKGVGWGALGPAPGGDLWNWYNEWLSLSMALKEIQVTFNTPPEILVEYTGCQPVKLSGLSLTPSSGKVSIPTVEVSEVTFECGFMMPW